MDKTNKWLERVEIAKGKALRLPKYLKTKEGYKYTVNHDIEKYPAAGFYGSWSVVYLQNLLGNKNWLNSNKGDLLDYFNVNRTGDGLFFPIALDSFKYPK